MVNSILSKASNSNFSIPSINKILIKLADAIESNDKLLRLLAELEKPFSYSAFDGMEALSSYDILRLPEAEGFTPSTNTLSSFQQRAKTHGLAAKKRYGEAEGVYVLPDSGPVNLNPVGDATVPVESIMGTVPGLKTQYDKLLTNEESARNGDKAIKKLATGQMNDIKKIKGMKTVFEARQGDVRVYFQKEDDLVKIIAPCLKKDQDKSIKILKKSFK